MKHLGKAKWCVQSVPVNCLGTLVEGNNLRWLVSYVTLQALDCLCVNYRRKYVERLAEPRILSILVVTSKTNTMKTNHTLTNKPDPKTKLELDPWNRLIYLVTLVEGKSEGSLTSWVILQALGCLCMEYRRKYMSHHSDPGSKSHQVPWSWVLKKTESSSMYVHNDTTWMSDANDWAWKEVAYREQAACNETSGMSGTCDWVLKETPRTVSSARVLWLDVVCVWRPKACVVYYISR